MGQMTNFMENKEADRFRGQGRPSYPTNWYIAAGSASGEGTFTEVTGIGLSRAVVARSLAKWAGTQGPGTVLASSGTSHASSNNDDIALGTPTGSATMNCVGFFDASSGGNCWIYLPVEPVEITAGNPDPVVIVAGALQFSLGLIGFTGCSDYLANKLTDDVFRGQAYNWPATIYPCMFVTAPTNAGGGAEPSGGSYARPAFVPSLASMSGTQAPGSTAASSGSGGRTGNNVPIAFPAPTADYDITADGIKDAATLGNLLFWKARTSPRSYRAGGPAPTYAIDKFGINVG